MHRPITTLWPCLLGALVAGCPTQELAPIQPCTVSGVAIDVQQTATSLDVLFVVDDSNSMAQEQRALARELPRMVRVLASGDLDEDGSPDFPAVQDMHLAVVSTDLGAAGQDTDDKYGCALPGDDGQFAFPAQAGGESERHFLTFHEGDDPQQLGSDFGALTSLGTSGCGMEQQLDAMLKALTPPTSPLRFFGGSVGHGGPAGSGAPNAGFLRDEAVLAVILVTDEDDCSLPDDAAGVMDFDGGPYADEPLNLRCGLHPDVLHPVTRYRDGLRALKPVNPEQVIFAAITGIPTSLEGVAPEQVLADPSMQFRSKIPESDPHYASAATPEASCTTPNPDYDPSDPNSKRLQEATPARRLVETAALFGESGVVRSICQEHFTGALDAIIRKISEHLPEPCLPQPLVRNAKGTVDCDVEELIPDDGRGEALCDASKGRTPLGHRTVADPQTGQDLPMQVCSVQQLPVVDGTPVPDQATARGWYYDDFSEQTRTRCASRPQQVRFSDGALPAGRSVVRLTCLRAVSGAGETSRGKRAVGRDCQGDEAICDAHACTPTDVVPGSDDCDKLYVMACESVSNTCQIRCASDADCPDAWVCQPDPVAGGLCVLATCPSF